MSRATELGYLLIGQPELSSQVARALATKGDQPSLIEPRYQLGITSLDLSDMQYRFLRRSPTWEAGVQQAAVAGAFPIVAASFQFTSPRVMAIIEEININNGEATAQTYQFGITTAGIGGVAANSVGIQCDDRFGAPAARGALTVGIGSNAASPALATMRFIRIQSGDTKVIRGPWILSGNANAVFQAAFVVVGGNINTAMGVGLRWYERAPLASEL